MFLFKRRPKFQRASDAEIQSALWKVWDVNGAQADKRQSLAYLLETANSMKTEEIIQLADKTKLGKVNLWSIVATHAYEEDFREISDEAARNVLDFVKHSEKLEGKKKPKVRPLTPEERFHHRSHLVAWLPHGSSYRERAKEDLQSDPALQMDAR